MNSAAPISELLHSRRSEILAAASRRGARNLRLFGSVARGEAGPDSDVDFLIDLEPDRTLLDHAGLMLDLQRILGRKVDVVTEDGLRAKMKERILREAIPI